jgi:chromate reductase, NAD(P)H dehydrogenase (quinone)
VRVLGISGSLRRESHNRRLLAAAARGLPAGVEFEELLGLELVPPFNEDLDGDAAPAAVEDLRAALQRADAVLIATPEYNHSIPGQLKNALDWASRPFPDNALRAKPAAVIGASTSLFGGVWAQAEVRRVLTAAGARPLDEELPVPSAHLAFEADGDLRDRGLQAALSAVTERLLEEAGVAVGGGGLSELLAGSGLDGDTRQ